MPSKKTDSWDKNTPAGKRIFFESPAPEPEVDTPTPTAPGPEENTPTPTVPSPEDITAVPAKRSKFCPFCFPWIVMPATGITSGMPLDQPKDLNYKDLGLTVEIPSVSSSAKIVEVPFSDGDYPVARLGKNAGSLEGFARPGEGISVVVGHNHLDRNEAGPFMSLKSVQIGDRVFIRSAQGKIDIYVVFANEKISETDFDALEDLAFAKENVLILMTCEDERVGGGYENRRIIAASDLASDTSVS